MSIEQLKSRPYFATSDITRLGVDKKLVKNNNNFVCLGSFPTRDAHGGTVLQNIYTYSPELAKIVKQANKLHKNPNTTDETKNYFVGLIEQKTREIFGWNDQQETEGEINDGRNQNGNTEEESAS